MSVTIAHQLKAAREQRGLSLADAAHATRIPAIRLAQMEEGNFAAFGSMAYARSFVVLYSSFLGVDASAFVSKLPKPQLGGASDYRYLTTSLGPWVEDQKTVRHRFSTRAHRHPKQHANPGLHAMLIFLGVAACTTILGVESFSAKGVRSINQAPMSSASTPPTTRAVTMVKPLSTEVNVAAVSSEHAKPITFAIAKPSAPHREPNLLASTTLTPSPVAPPPTPKEEVRVPDVTGFRVERAEPVTDDTAPAYSPDL
jgi:cytoskeletal protein RodZ